MAKVANKQAKLDPFKFTDEDLYDALPSHNAEYATLSEVCQKLCYRIMHKTDGKEHSRRIEQKVRRHLTALVDRFPNLIDINVNVKPQLYRKKIDVHAENKQTIRQLGALQDLIGQYLPIEQQKALANQVSKANGASWKQFICVAPSSICTAPKCSVEVKASVYTAIEQKQALAFKYLNSGRKVSQKQLMPWGLMFKGEKTYVIGIETNDKATKPLPYAMHRMSEMRIIPFEAHFKSKPVDMTMTEICKLHGIDLFKKASDQTIKLVLRLFGDAANNIDGTPISDDQVVEELIDGTRELRATVLWGYELEKFIRGLGPNAEVIEPLELRQKLSDEYQKLASRYNGLR